MSNARPIFSFLICGVLTLPILAAPPEPKRADQELAQYFRAETAAIAEHCLSDIHTLDDWTSHRAEYRRQLAEMLGLWPEPERTDLKPVITGKIDHADFTVEKLHLQSRPGLYVTCNLYLPKNQSGPVPAVLYVCGHGIVKKDGVSFGNKTYYQYYGEWLARNGYVCLIVDTLELGEIDGIHHGLYRLGMWDWQSRGYTPAGVEAWNSIRCLDYLQTRPEVDPQRLAMMGRSGGGATTWFTAALDERIKVAIPAAGITDLTNHIVDGTIEGHCDCMFMVNTYRWDFAQLAALIAPRALLFSNSDKDTIFPLDGVERVHAKLRNIYKLYKADDKLGLLITEGPHKDTQELQLPAFKWLNRFLRNDLNPLKDVTADSLYQPADLRVFPLNGESADQINSKIQSLFLATAPTPSVPASAEAWNHQRDALMNQLSTKTFAGWPKSPPPLDVTLLFTRVQAGVELRAYEFVSQAHVRLRFYMAQPEGGKQPDRTTLRILGQQEWTLWLSAMRTAFAEQLAPELQDSAPAEPDEKAFAELRETLRSDPATLVFFPPRGIGPTAWAGDAKHQTQILRRFGLLGQTLDGQRVWDIRRALQAVHSLDPSPIRIAAQGRSAALALYASLYEPDISALQLTALPTSHRDGPDLLNVLKTLDVPAAVALAVERCPVELHQSDANAWQYPRQTAVKLKGPYRFDIIPPR